MPILVSRFQERQGKLTLLESGIFTNLESIFASGGVAGRVGQIAVLSVPLTPIMKREPVSIVWREPQELSSIRASPSEAHFSSRFVLCLVRDKTIDW
jgi:hypothetical protein